MRGEKVKKRNKGKKGKQYIKDFHNLSLISRFLKKSTKKLVTFGTGERGPCEMIILENIQTNTQYFSLCAAGEEG